MEDMILDKSKSGFLRCIQIRKHEKSETLKYKDFALFNISMDCFLIWNVTRNSA